MRKPARAARMMKRRDVARKTLVWLLAYRKPPMNAPATKPRLSNVK